MSDEIWEEQVKEVTPLQILGAEIRAAREAWELKHRKRGGKNEGWWILPPSEKRYKYLSKKFGLTPYQLKFFFTYARSCTHEWSEGACPDCPKNDHIPL